MSDLKTTLERTAAEFAYAMVAALKGFSFEELNEKVVPKVTAPLPPPIRGRIAKQAVAAGPRPAAPARVTVAPRRMQSETELSILEHLNEAGPTGSTVKAWVISTQGELPQAEHDELERAANKVLDALEARKAIQKRGFSKSRGTVYALSPV